MIKNLHLCLELSSTYEHRCFNSFCSLLNHAYYKTRHVFETKLFTHWHGLTVNSEQSTVVQRILRINSYLREF